MNETNSRRSCPECGLPLSEDDESSGCAGCSLRLALSPGAPRPPALPSALPGLKSRYFGDYEILDEIARGGMGVVYRARHLDLNRLVALKMVQSHHLLSDEAALRFRVEIEAVAQLNHPHIVSLYESGEHEGAHYFTMSLVEGGDLSARLQRDWPLRERVQLLVKVCRAVHYAHQRGILHRDLKPSNILVDRQGEPHVADFGLAKSLDQDAGFTFTSSVLGSPNYMAPEQAAGQTRQLTTAVDVYGLGAVLYHLLAGRPPFLARTPIETLRRVVDEEPVSPGTLAPGTDRDLETMALKCLRKEPAARYASAEELAQDLERWLQGLPILARPLSVWTRAWRWSWRHPLATALGVALLLSLAAILVGTGVAVVHIQRAEGKSAASLRESLLREAASLRLGGEVGHRTEGLRLLREASALGGPAEFRLRARNELLATLARTEMEFVLFGPTNLPARPGHNAVLFRRRILASITNESTIAFHSLRDGSPMGRLSYPPDPVVSIEASSPDGRYAAARHQASFRIWELDTGKYLTLPLTTNLAFAFHPSERLILIQTNANEAVGLELPSGEERFRWVAPMPRLSGRDSGWHTLAWSPDGRTLAGASGTSLVIELMNPDTGGQVRFLTNTAQTVAMSWSHDGGLLAAASGDNRILLWEMANGVLRWESPAMVNRACSLAFHPSGKWLAAACEDDQIRLIDLATERFAHEHPGESRQLSFSPRGDQLGPIHRQGRAGLLEFRPPVEFSGFELNPNYVRLSGGRFSADGRILSVGHSDTVFLCDPVRGVRFRTKNDWRMSACVFSPSKEQMIVAEDNGVVLYRHSFGTRRELALSSPEVLHSGTGWIALDLSPDERHFVGYNRQSRLVTVFDYTLTNRLAVVGPHADVGDVAVSPDGRWVTTGSHANRNLNLWDVASGALLRTVTLGAHPRGAFSSDGRWLAVNGEDKFELWETGTWRNVPSVPQRIGRQLFGAAAFSPDGGTLAIVVDRFSVQLFDLGRRVCIGTLRPPVASQIQGLAYAPDGSMLAAFGNGARVAVWHLRELERAMADFDLSWDSTGPR